MRVGQHHTGQTAMRGRRRSIRLALAAVLLLAAGVSAQVPFTSAEGGYSISFPAVL
jgi:hypothetical protein